MKKYFIPFSLGFMLLISFSPSASAGVCGLSIVADNVSISWNLSFVNIGFNFTVQKASEVACSYALGFGTGGALDYSSRNAQGLKYQIYKDAGSARILKDVPAATTADEIIQGSFGAGTNLSNGHTYYIAIPLWEATHPAITGVGTYRNTFTINAYETAGIPGALDPVAASDTVEIVVTVADFIKVSLVNTGSAFDEALIEKSIDFGSLYKGKKARFDINVRTNASYSISCVSANAGKLANGSSLVPYKFYIDTVETWSGSGTGPTTMEGTAHQIMIEIGEISGKVAGSYTDRIDIEATSP